ncbi:MAG: hypothetical protein Q8K74_01400 [Candidatus Nitrotoga sp.]|nr:hypothetical protein [Candidatus Nitrotoga sp.]MDP1854694.1 hypothetical protein [Candidatus Nitrotoga sp.]
MMVSKGVHAAAEEPLSLHPKTKFPTAPGIALHGSMDSSATRCMPHAARLIFKRIYNSQRSKPKQAITRIDVISVELMDEAVDRMQ